MYEAISIIIAENLPDDITGESSLKNGQTVFEKIECAIDGVLDEIDEELDI